MESKEIVKIKKENEICSSNYIKVSEVKRKSRVLNIYLSEIENCNSYYDYRKLIKNKFREKIRETHPDRVKKERSRGRKARHRPAKYGADYNKVINAYRFLCKITEGDLKALEKFKSAPDIELPLDWGMGWREYSTQYAGYQVLPRI